MHWRRRQLQPIAPAAQILNNPSTDIMTARKTCVDLAVVTDSEDVLNTMRLYDVNPAASNPKPQPMVSGPYWNCRGRLFRITPLPEVKHFKHGKSITKFLHVLPEPPQAISR
jgi:hypothetical protein